MQVSVNGPSLNNFSPDKALELWWAAAQKKRHVQRHKSRKIQVNEVVYSKISSDSDEYSEFSSSECVIELS